MKRIVGVMVVALQLAGCLPNAYYVAEMWPVDKGGIVVKTCGFSPSRWEAEGECRYDRVDVGDLPDEAREGLRQQRAIDAKSGRR